MYFVWKDKLNLQIPSFWVCIPLKMYSYLYIIRGKLGVVLKNIIYKHARMNWIIKQYFLICAPFLRENEKHSYCIIIKP